MKLPLSERALNGAQEVILMEEELDLAHHLLTNCVVDEYYKEYEAQFDRLYRLKLARKNDE